MKLQTELMFNFKKMTHIEAVNTNVEYIKTETLTEELEIIDN